MVLLYCICSGKSIAVGILIRDSILKIMRAATTGGHGHASLITRLCRAAGELMNEIEPCLQNTTIDHGNLTRGLFWQGGTPRPSGLGFEVDDL